MVRGRRERGGGCEGRMMEELFDNYEEKEKKVSCVYLRRRKWRRKSTLGAKGVAVYKSGDDKLLHTVHKPCYIFLL